MRQTPILLVFLAAALLDSCCGTSDLDARYQPIGPAVMQANRLLMLDFPDGPPPGYTGEQYKTLLKEEYPPLYEKIEPFTVEVIKTGSRFLVKVFDKNTMVLMDAACTESRLDCWVYKNECDPDSFAVSCP